MVLFPTDGFKRDPVIWVCGQPLDSHPISGLASNRDRARRISGVRVASSKVESCRVDEVHWIPRDVVVQIRQRSTKPQ